MPRAGAGVSGWSRSGVPMQPVAHLLTFALDELCFGIAVADVREITRVAGFARMPKAPQVIEGVLNFRGTAVPVLDIRARFRLPPRSVRPSDHLIIARAGPRLVAVRVDRVLDLVSVDAADIEDVAAITAHSDHVAGVVKLPGEIIFIHALATFLTAAEAADLDRSLEPAPS